MTIDGHCYDIPYLRTLRDRLWDIGSARTAAALAPKSGNGWKRLHALDRDLEQLPYCLHGTFDALVRVAAAQEHLVESAASEGALKPGVVYLLPTERRDEMAFPFDSFLDFARRTQNAVTRYIHRALDLSIPASLSDAVKGMRSKKLPITGDLALTLDHYWTDSGEKLKAYRDLAQHHTLLSSDGRVFLDGANVPSIYLAIPNNPEERSPRALEYATPAVHALPYAIRAYQDLYRFVFVTSVQLLASTGEVAIGPASVSLLPKDPLHSGSQPGHNWIEPVRVVTRLWKLRRDLEEYVLTSLPNGSEDSTGTKP